MHKGLPVSQTQCDGSWKGATKNEAIASLPLAKDINILEHLSQTLSGAHWDNWKKACMAELNQMTKRDVWDVIKKELHIKKIGYWWVFDIKHNTKGTVEKFKGRLVAHGDHQ
ncbi:hypothetical protein O181_000171 [Austropuccinia psidii MF-1]|uniref:Reverse transcriptase Ty1/copia-type domain-containing protein n=1 Tax=Austropuccinia psidii MF-1 TaxID=1389203 RepID=A0A9Q3B836_9BASI|nr:hypothetical protein [Austropuccinia psidii MF-1]